MTSLSVWSLVSVFILLIVLACVAGLWWWTRRRLGIQSITSPTPLTFRVIEVEGWSIHYHRWGHGPDLLLIHGIGADLMCWRPLLPFLSDHFTVTVLDLPGFGHSSKLIPADYGLDAQVERLLAFLDALRIRTTFVVGNSMGGNIALWLALKHANRVSGVAVIAPATRPGLVPIPLAPWTWLSHPLSLMLNRHTLGWAHRRVVSRPHLIDAARIESSLQVYARNHEAVRSFLLATAAIRDPRLPKSLAGVRDRVLLLWGSNDRLVSRRVIEELESLLPDVESHIHLGGGHHLQEDEPEWVAQKLREFLLS